MNLHPQTRGPGHLPGPAGTGSFSNPGSSLLLAAALLLCGAACNPERDVTWNLVWSDDFEGQAGRSPDPEKWTWDLGASGWGNNELQNYTDRPENASLDGRGRLDIKAIREDFDGAPWTSARLKTQGLFSHQYGRWEARIQLPAGRGLWPAFWLLGDNIADVGWPLCGEIDILELRGSNPKRIGGTMHGPGYSGSGGIGTYYDLESGTFADDFHTFAVEHDPERVWWYVDDELYWTVTKGEQPGAWPFDQPYFAILNVAVGGNYPLPPDASTPDEAVMKVDYVRVFEAAE